MNSTYVAVTLGAAARGIPWAVVIPALTGLLTIAVSFRAFKVAHATAQEALEDRLIARYDQLKDARGDTLKLHAAGDRLRTAIRAPTPEMHRHWLQSALAELSDLKSKPHWPDTAFLGQVDFVRIANDWSFGNGQDVLDRVDELIHILEREIALLTTKVDEAEAKVKAFSGARRLAEIHRRPFRRLWRWARRRLPFRSRRA